MSASVLKFGLKTSLFHHIVEKLICMPFVCWFTMRFRRGIILAKRLLQYILFLLLLLLFFFFFFFFFFLKDIVNARNEVQNYRSET